MLHLWTAGHLVPLSYLGMSVILGSNNVNVDERGMEDAIELHLTEGNG